MLKRWLMFVAAAVLSANVFAAGFSLTDIHGKTHTLSDYRGKWVLVNFWATWCPPCLEEIPDLVALYEKHKDTRLMVIGIAVEYQNPQQITEFAENMLISYPIVLGNPAIVAQIGQITALPTTYLYNPQGKLVAYNVGALTRQDVESYISAKP